jgi:SAM-dependent methyltransferase
MRKDQLLWQKAVRIINEDPACKTIVDVGARGRGENSSFPNKKFQTLNLNPGDHPDIVADAHDTKIPTGSVDAVISLSLLEHCHSPHIVVDEIKRILRPKGYVFIGVPFVHPYHGNFQDGAYWPDFWRFTKDGLGYLFRDFDFEMESDGGVFYAARDFVPPALGPLQRPISGMFTLLDRVYSRGQSRHAYVLFGTKKA